MLTIGVVLFVVWFVGFMILRKVVGAFIHLVLIVAIIAIAWHFFGNRGGTSKEGHGLDYLTRLPKKCQAIAMIATTSTR